MIHSFDQLEHTFNQFLQQEFSLEPEVARSCVFTLNVDARRQQFGDISSNAPLVIGKARKVAPAVIASAIQATFSDASIARIELAGPGFLNITLTHEAIGEIGYQLYHHADEFFKPAKLTPQRINIEFVSANPTGPLHFGHGRGGIIGDVLARVLNFVGHTVTKEFYINDAGNQIALLGKSFKIRCQQECGNDVTLPEEGYHGEYLVLMAKQFIEKYGVAGLEHPDQFFAEYAQNILLAQLQETLLAYGITFDVWFSERQLHTSGAITQALEILANSQYLYEQDGATWLKTTIWGDDKDRVVRKASGELTYVAADIAYMRNKVSRGYDHLIMILGHDHHSYAVRMQGVRSALGLSQGLTVLLYQLVKIKEGDQYMRLSKRAGRIISLEQIIEAVGTDVARFFYLYRNADAQLEFDMALALSKTEENPVYYVQYAYVRTGSVLQKASGVPHLEQITADDMYQLGDSERLLLKKLYALKDVLHAISTKHQTHLLAFYVHELAQLFSSYYGAHTIIDTNNIAQSRGRLALVTVLRRTLELCFKLLGINSPERM